jgi:hypothetical protein
MLIVGITNYRALIQFWPAEFNTPSKQTYSHGLTKYDVIFTGIISNKKVSPFKGCSDFRTKVLGFAAEKLLEGNHVV